MKTLWGTDERCRRDFREGERMIAEAERKVEALSRTLDERPAANLDEAMQQITHQER